MSSLVALCRTATPFTRTGEVDEDALRRYLQMFIDAKVGVHLGSSGNGEGHALTRDELRRIYRVGVEVCKGRVQVNATPPEHHTARVTIEQSLLAAESGIEVVNVFGPAGWHNYRPTDEEYLAYHDTVLKAVKHPVAVSPNPSMGYAPKAEHVAAICNKYHQVVAVNLATLEPDDTYFLELKARLKREVAIFVMLPGSHHTFSLGAAGVIGGEFAINPMTCRRYLDHYEKNNHKESNLAYADLRRFNKFTARWRPANARWIKMAMKLLKLPGGEGGVREPYMMPSEAEYQKFCEGLLKLRIPEIDAMARAAGVAVPG